MDKKVSIIIPAYNAEATLDFCLSSIYKSTYKDFEVVVVDDGSVDKTREIAGNYPVRLLTQENKGPAVARNLAAKHANSEFLFFLDSDVLVFADTIQKFMDTFDKDPRIDVVNGIYYYLPANKGVIPLYKAMFDYFWLTDGKLNDYPVFLASCVVIKRKVFEAVGGFNESYAKGIDIENDELGYRLSQKYYSIINPQIIVRHYFPYFKKSVRLFYKRTFILVKFFLHRKSFNPTGPTTPRVAIGTFAGFMVGACIFLVFLYPKSYILSLLFLLIMLGVYFKFFLFVLKKKGFWIMLFSIGITFFYTLVVGIAATIGLIDSGILYLSRKGQDRYAFG